MLLVATIIKLPAPAISVKALCCSSRYLGAVFSAQGAGFCRTVFPCRTVFLLQESLHRLVYSNETKEEELDTLREYLHRPQDPATGQSLFQPKILRGPRTPRNREGEHAGKHMGTALHDARDQIRAHRKAMEDAAAKEQVGGRTHPFALCLTHHLLHCPGRRWRLRCLLKVASPRVSRRG